MKAVEERDRKIIELYTVRKLSAENTALEVGCTTKCVWNALKRHGVPSRPTGGQPGAKFHRVQSSKRKP